MSEDWWTGIDSAIGTAIGRALARPVVRARFDRSAQESSGHLDDGEKLAAPVANCTRGGRVPLLVGAGIFVAAVIAGIVVANVKESLAGVVFFGGMGAGYLLMLLALPLAHKHAVALTDRRLIVFTKSRMSGRHILDVFIAAPRSDVSTDFKVRLGWGVLSLELAPATGRAPFQLDFWSVDTQIAGAIHRALATAGTSAQAATR